MVPGPDELLVDYSSIPVENADHVTTVSKARNPQRVVIDHFSLDPPGLNTSLVFPYAPLKRRPTLDDIERKSDPLDTLPRALIPRSHASLRPPVLRYGWVADEEDFIELARKYNCIKTRAPYDPKEFEDEDEADGEPEPPNWLHEGDPRWPDIDILDTINAVMVQVANDLGVKIPDLDFGGAMRDGECTIVSLFTNYDVTQKLPSQEDIERYGAALGVTEKPKWYLDEMNTWWTTRRYLW
ncbi:hypothetical protein POSPLADRAFT_1075404 [Postia placenta MAD-698-R-SB12]|uniref:Uncharacterized protein n=1 Tax=Postia placenta MAD-698-R-SB12 TaxID=670580 RepID=A0A1X6MUA0_9APHY|nr:hypothetical protein POSPLADRAFT_1075404 [Postia placenta MAD-698-R-SB12]OSX59964.1 hypothetical protein POSPLADRAFT_1075404 [Postia placenta MAD-698-R-SB12]